MRPTRKSSSGTSFHGHSFKATPDQLRAILGQPKFETNDGMDKTNFDWTMETETGAVFTVYDWKHYRMLDEHELVSWNIGALRGQDSREAMLEIIEALEELGQ
jgi:hypothetical protein